MAIGVAIPAVEVSHHQQAGTMCHDTWWISCRVERHVLKVWDVELGLWKWVLELLRGTLRGIFGRFAFRSHG